jgi:glycogen debranching enzyme
MSSPDEPSAEPYYIVAESAPSLERSRVLRQGDSFALLDPFGDISGKGSSTADGLFHAGTRYLSQARMTFSGKRLLLLSSHISFDNGLLRVDLTNADLLRGDQVVVPRGSLHLERSMFLWNACLYETVRLSNYGAESIACGLHFDFAADFADVFEVRGTHRERRGTLRETRIDGAAMIFAYQGLDHVERQTRIIFDRQPTRLAPGHAEFDAFVAPGRTIELALTIACAENGASVGAMPVAVAAESRQQASRAMQIRDCRIYTANEQFNEWVNQSFSDVRLMLTETPGGLYPFAGVPWYSTEFGRDGLLTALETLWFNPAMARGVLSFLAATQAHENDQASAAEPGKIVHEIRRGEMPNLNEVPFGRYYGSVDATPLFVLAGCRVPRSNGGLLRL